VAARGLDFPEVTTIIQYDPPGEASECVFSPFGVTLNAWLATLWTSLTRWTSLAGTSLSLHFNLGLIGGNTIK
jgi:hypothetical protein